MSGKRIAILVVLLLVLCCVVAALGGLLYWYFFGPPAVPPVEAAAEPTVLIDSPLHGDEVTVGQIVQVFATGRDMAGITHMELWVDGNPIEIQRSARPEGTNPFVLMANWQPSTPGSHTIVVRAYNTFDVSGQASISVNAVEAPPISGQMPAEGCDGVLLMAHEVQEGETLEGIAAGFEVTVEEILACNPGLDPAAPLSPGTTLLIPYLVTPEEEQPPPPEQAPPEPPAEPPPDVEPGPGEESPPEETEPPPEEPTPEPAPTTEPPPPVPTPPPPVALEFEALELEVNHHYIAVYCLVELQGNMERVPPDELDFLDPVGPEAENYWDIAAELSGANSVPLAVLSGDTLNLYVHCYGFYDPGDLSPYDLGSVTRQYPEANWNGEPIEVWSEGGEVTPEGEVGQYRGVFRICQGSCEPREIERPYNLQYDYTPALEHHITWNWDGDEATIDGFRLYRNGGLYRQQEGADLRIIQIEEPDTQPWCNETWEYTLTAYDGAFGVGLESLPSDSVEFPPVHACTGGAEVTFQVLFFPGLWTRCLLNDCPEPAPDCSNCEVPIWYGSIYGNSERIEVEPPVCTVLECPPWPHPGLQSWRCLGWAECLDIPYFVADAFDADTIAVPLEVGLEDLTLGISLADWDLHGPDSPICEGETTIAGADVVAGNWGYFWCEEGDPPVNRAVLLWWIVNVF